MKKRLFALLLCLTVCLTLLPVSAFAEGEIGESKVAAEPSAEDGVLADIEEPVNIEDTVTVTEPETAEESAEEEAPETVEEPAADEAPETAVEAALIEELTVEEAPTDAGQGEAIAEEPAEIERPDVDEEEPISLDAEIEEVSEELDAELAGEIYEGNCGDNVKWRLDGDSGTLTVSGSGAMYNHLAGSQAQPWYSQRSLIKSVIIGRGVTHIGSYTFIGCRNLYDAIIPDTVTSVGSSAFASSGLQLVKVPASVTQIGQDAFGSSPQRRADQQRVQFRVWLDRQDPGQCLYRNEQTAVGAAALHCD